ncbi:MAG: polyprenyl synthetase family protein [Christensenellaceae bacterium]|jgi:geranylgeranyl diphosphate synthase type II|nr:polyprenyl synthetase family protein [Christensenellaceae bacterium]
MHQFECYFNGILSDVKGEVNPVLHCAITYAACSGGKRVRPKLMLMMSEIVGVSVDVILPYAAALELIHTYSLIHDDLPAMDNDDIRRGLPTVHKVFGDAVALLAGDALLNFAYETLFHRIEPTRSAILAATKLSEAAGMKNMVSGQATEFVAQTQDLNGLFDIYRKKTGALIAVAFTIPCILADLPPSTLQTFEKIGNLVGLIFQLVDDLIDTNTTDENEITAVTIIGCQRTKDIISAKTNVLISLLRDAPYDCTMLTNYLLELSNRCI